MSDVGSLSYEYERANELARKLDATLSAPGCDVDRQARSELRPLLLALVDLLDPLHASQTDTNDVMSVPIGLAVRLRGREFNGRPIGDALGALAGTMSHRDAKLTEEDMRLLREVNGETAREVSTAFRRMVRR
jgi:hypothetical protein